MIGKGQASNMKMPTLGAPSSWERKRNKQVISDDGGAAE
jgi:hypothetical protein